MAFSYDLLPPIIPDVLIPITTTTKQIEIPITMEATYQQSLEQYNIKSVQYSIIDQNNNANTHRVGWIHGSDVLRDPTQENTFILKIPVLNNKNTEKNETGISLEINKFYKIQLRFSNTLIDTNTQQSVLTTSEYYSEWSSVCLIKKIVAPTLQLSMGIVTKLEENKTQYVYQTDTISGFVHSSDDNLKSYQIFILQQQQGSYKTIHKTDLLTPISQNSFKYVFNNGLQAGEHYRIQIICYMINGYRFFNSYTIKVIQAVEDSEEEFYLKVAENPEIGTNDISILVPKTNQNLSYKNNFIIYRASSETQYSTWEKIKIIQFNTNHSDISLVKVKDPTSSTNTKIDMWKFTWHDITIKSGIFYKYKIAILYQSDSPKEYFIGHLVSTLNETSSFSCLFEDMYLIGENKSLRIKFNPTITNFKYNIAESIKNTLGSKYPFINRNGKSFYRSFSIGGLITSYMDTEDRTSVPYSLNDSYIRKEEEVVQEIDLYNDSSSEVSSLFKTFIPGPQNKFAGNFATEEEIYADNDIVKINQYNEAHFIDQYEDVILEREFRELVYQFLYNNKVKLFRSNPEGNILVKLTNISFTPMEQLGRQLYSFTAEATEIDQCSLANLIKYNIYDLGKWQDMRGFSNIDIYNDSYNISSPRDSISIDIFNEVRKKHKNTIPKINATENIKNLSNIVISFKSNSKSVNIKTLQYQVNTALDKDYIEEGWILKVYFQDSHGYNINQKIFINKNRPTYTFPSNITFTRMEIITEKTQSYSINFTLSGTVSLINTKKITLYQQGDSTQKKINPNRTKWNFNDNLLDLFNIPLQNSEKKYFSKINTIEKKSFTSYSLLISTKTPLIAQINNANNIIIQEGKTYSYNLINVSSFKILGVQTELDSYEYNATGRPPAGINISMQEKTQNLEDLTIRV